MDIKDLWDDNTQIGNKLPSKKNSKNFITLIRFVLRVYRKKKEETVDVKIGTNELTNNLWINQNI